MKNGALKVWTTQVAQKVDEELKTESDTDRVCQLLDAREYLRRTWQAFEAGIASVSPQSTTGASVHWAAFGDSPLTSNIE